MTKLLKKSPVFTSVLALLAVALAGEGWCLWERHAAAVAAGRLVRDREGQLRQLADAVPPPTPEMADQIMRDLARTDTALAAMQAELQGHGPAAERLRKIPPPKNRTDAFFDIASFVERTRERARRAGVTLADQEMFGFSLYAHTGPEAALIPAVFQQRQIAQYVVEALLDARPRQLVAFQRERPLSPQERAARAQAAGQGNAGDTANPAEAPEEALAADMFAIEPRLSARAPGFVETQAFRATFVGYTTTLRGFLNKLASFELPLVVRQVEATPVSPDEANQAAAASAADRPATAADSGRPAATAAVPIVPRSLSKFTVTMEFIELVAPPAPSAAAPAPPVPAR